MRPKKNSKVNYLIYKTILVISLFLSVPCVIAQTTPSGIYGTVIDGSTSAPHPFGLLEPFLNLTVMKSKMEEQGSMVMNKENPSVIAGGGVFIEKKGMGINILCKYVSPFENERFAPPAAGPQPLGDFFTVDIKGGYTFQGRVPVNLYLRIRNLTNAKYSTVVGYPDFGRMIYAGILIKFARYSAL